MKKPDGTTWSFVDLLLLLVVAFLVTAQVEKKEANDNDEPIPKIHLFLEETDGGYATKCNGRYVDGNDLLKIVRSALEHNPHGVQVVAMIEDQIPYGYVDRIKRACLSVKLGQIKGKPIKASWDSKPLVNFAKN